MAKSPHVLTAQGHTHDGYSFLVFARGRGKRRVYWWHCGGCWQTSGDPRSISEEDLNEAYLVHRWICPAQVFSHTLDVVQSR
ncbi:hypothetical protein ADL27_53285 [Streptomyces sp. NRRL F-6602]|nr:hypothetical protein ADL27_53285 [Streptomyces sp. NRRL F-6602]